MAINKKLIHFLKRESFDKELKAGNILETSICFIKDSQQLYTHKQFYDCSGMNEDLINELIESYLYEIIPDTVTNGYEYVDMEEAGVWAKYPIGVSNYDTAQDDVLYFSWGDVVGHTGSEINNKSYSFDPANDKYCGNPDFTYFGYNGSDYKATKYCINNEYGKDDFIDFLTELLPEDDAAHINMGGAWRMPTREEFLKLLDNCNRELIKNYSDSGINGVLFTLKSNESKLLFLPMLGHCTYENLNINNARFWTKSLSSPAHTSYQLSGSDYGTLYLNVDSTVRYQGLCIIGILDSKLPGNREEKYLPKKDTKWKTIPAISVLHLYDFSNIDKIIIDDVEYDSPKDLIYRKSTGLKYEIVPKEGYGVIGKSSGTIGVESGKHISLEVRAAYPTLNIEINEGIEKIIVNEQEYTESKKIEFPINTTINYQTVFKSGYENAKSTINFENSGDFTEEELPDSINGKMYVLENDGNYGNIHTLDCNFSNIDKLIVMKEFAGATNDMTSDGNKEDNVYVGNFQRIIITNGSYFHYTCRSGYSKIYVSKDTELNIDPDGNLELKEASTYNLSPKALLIEE